MKNLNLIAAVGENLELGKNNKIIWNIERDNNFFKSKIENSYIIMGTKTYNSIPKNLKARGYIVLSKETIFDDKNIIVFREFQESLDFIRNNDDSFYVIGGGQIYRLYLNYVETMYLTEIKASCREADAFFPNFDSNCFKKEILEEGKKGPINYKIMQYMRKKA